MSSYSIPSPLSGKHPARNSKLPKANSLITGSFTTSHLGLVCQPQGILTR